MDALVEFISNNPLYAAGVVVLLLVMVFAAIKKMIAVALIAICLNIAYVYYLHDIAEKSYSKASQKYGKAKDAAKDIIDDASSLLNK